MEGVLTNAMSGATEESLQSLHSHRDTDPTHYVGWDPSRLYAVHRSLLSLSFLLWDIRVNSIHFDAEELMKTLRETRQVLDAAHFSARSYPLAYNGRIEYVRSSLQAILVSANLMRPPPQWLRRYLRNRGYPGLPALKLVGFATIQERECGICMVEYSQGKSTPSSSSMPDIRLIESLELGNEIVHLPCDERHSASGSG